MMIERLYYPYYILITTLSIPFLYIGDDHIHQFGHPILTL